MASIPKQIWLWWEQGWEKAPFICSYTIKSFEKLNPEFQINLVCKKNLSNYLEDYEWVFECEGPAFRADIIRLLLLKKYGGVYSDAVTFCCVNLNDFLQEISFDRFWAFDIKSFNELRNDKRTVASWFYISTENNYLINTFTNVFIEKAKQNPKIHHYFLHHHTLTELIESDREFEKWYENLTKISAFQNRIQTKYLDAMIDKIQIKEPEWFHPRNIKASIDNDQFKIIKLRHRNIASQNQLLKANTVFHHLCFSFMNTTDSNLS